MTMATDSAVIATDIFTLAQAQRVAVMLDLDPQHLAVGDPVPRGWHFALLAGQTHRRLLRSDGFPGLGVTMPQMDLPRLLLGQRNTIFQSDLLIGGAINRQSKIVSIANKAGRDGPFSIAKIEHQLTSDSDPSEVQSSVLETQTYFLLSLPNPKTPATDAKAKPDSAAMPTEGVIKVVTPDDLMLFQYSALGYNTHRIHFDRDYATRVEGHPDLVVNGGLATLLATEFLRNELGRKIKSLTARHLAPLYVNRPMTIFAPDLTDAQANILLMDCDGIVAAELMINFDEL